MYADVILPLPLADVFTYAVPREMQNVIGKGFSVIVPFGNRKHYTGIVKNIHQTAPVDVEAKEIHSLIDVHPVVNERQLKMWEWISFYYLSPLGDVYKAAMPSALKPSDLQGKFTSKTEKHVRIHPNFVEKYAKVIIGKAKKQVELFRQTAAILSERNLPSIGRKELLEITGHSSATLNGLIEKNAVEQLLVDVSRIKSDVTATREPYPLNEFQQQALNEISGCFNKKQTCLLHGVTSSGKTEIYIHLIEKMIAEGKQTLYLVPEIALTTQLTQRLQAVFGNRLGIYHSKINDNDRAEIWQKMLSDSPYEIVIGVRSSLFLPFRQLGLVIVDEEHETSYKQQEPAPRYHARDAAVMLAHISEAKTLLGSATPSLESYYNAKTGKYGLVTLDKRFEEIQLPQILLENTKELRRKRKMKSLLAPELIGRIQGALANEEQVILFRNRRGFAPVIECKLCAWTPKCRHCDVSLTYHKFRNQLVCHYCNTATNMPKACPECKEESLEMLGQGTEQLEEEAARLFPHARIARMDTDTTRGKNAYEKIIADFQENRVQMLVGTQMLSKGLDFGNVSVVGIISADALLNYPDFRSHERGFQLMTQAAGRAGRKNKRGTVIIQTANPEMPVYRFITENNYEAFFNEQLAERNLFKYPPFYRLIRIVFKDRNEQKSENASRFFADALRKSLNERVLGPNKPVIAKIQQYHIREILLKLETGLSPQQVRQLLKQTEIRLRSKQEFKYVVLYYDVDGT